MLGAGDLVSHRRHRRFADHDIGRGDVQQVVALLDEEVMVLSIVGVEIGLRSLERELAQQSCILELMQRVVDGRQRDVLAHARYLAMQALGRHVTVTLTEQKRGQQQPLPRCTQPGLREQGANLGFGSDRVRWGFHSRRSIAKFVGPIAGRVKTRSGMMPQRLVH